MGDFYEDLRTFGLGALRAAPPSGSRRGMQ
jgi:hypothetical protein